MQEQEQKPVIKPVIRIGPEIKTIGLKKIILFGILAGLVTGLLSFIISKNIIFPICSIILVPLIFLAYFYFTNNTIKSTIKLIQIQPKPLNILTPKSKEQKSEIITEDEILLKKKQKAKLKKLILFGILTGLIICLIYYAINRNIIVSLIIFFVTPVLFFAYDYFKKQLDKSARIKRIESVFPDFLQLMSSNLRAGMTIDRSMFLSVREEFFPLDEEIQKTAKDITTGKSVEVSLAEMAKRVNSLKIEKVVLLIISGIRAGGNLATLLEETAVNMREKEFVEKRASSNVLMYVIFIFLTVSVGAPGLFSLSSVLVEVLTHLLSSLPVVQAPNMPFTMSAVKIPVDFVIYFCLVFILTTDVLASLTLGLVNKGEEKEGLKYLIPLVILSLSVFFILRFFLSGFMVGLFS